MFRLRSRIAISQPISQQLLLQISSGRRLVFGLIAAVLIIAFFVGVDWQRDFGPDFSGGIVFYFALTAVCLSVAGWNSIVLLDRGNHRAVFLKRLFGVSLHQQKVELVGRVHVLVLSASFLKQREMPQPGALSNRFRNYAERRNVYYKLFIVVDDRRHFVEDSTDTDELERAAVAMSDFLGVEFRKEEI
ncbi:MAG: hypothetical protein ACLFP4_04465 [Spirochaetales bacterium]